MHVKCLKEQFVIDHLTFHSFWMTRCTCPDFDSWKTMLLYLWWGLWAIDESSTERSVEPEGSSTKSTQVFPACSRGRRCFPESRNWQNANVISTRFRISFAAPRVFVVERHRRRRSGCRRRRRAVHGVAASSDDCPAATCARTSGNSGNAVAKIEFLLDASWLHSFPWLYKKSRSLVKSLNISTRLTE